MVVAEPMVVPEANSCQQRAAELQLLLRNADAQWRSLESRLQEAEEQTLRTHADELQRWFGEEVTSSMSSWSDGGLRRKTRDRVNKLLLAHLTERIRKEAWLQDAESATGGLALADAEGEVESHPIDVLLEYWENSIETKLAEATKEDAKLGRKLRRLEKVGATRDAKKEEQRRVTLWSPAQEAIDIAEGPIRALARLLDEDLSAEAISRRASLVPSIVARSACDWHFQRCVGELEQLRGWWEGARGALQRRPNVWEKLLEQEGLFVRRIERGIEEIEAERCRYVALASFGHSGVLSAASGNGSRSGSEWPAEAAALLARAVSEMKRRLRPIRDAAVWRIIDAAKAIQKTIAEEERSKERPPWEQVGCIEGIAALCNFLGVALPEQADFHSALQKGAATFKHLDPADAALCFAGMLDRLAGLATDLCRLADSQAAPDTGGLSYILEEVLQATSYAHEDLLAVLDDATEANLSEWLRDSWGNWGDASTGERLGTAVAAMPMKADSMLRPQERQARRSQLALLRGLQALLMDGGFRLCLLQLVAANLGGENSHVAPSECGEVAVVATPQASPELVDFEPLTMCGLPTAPALTSPRGGYASRKPERPSVEPDAQILPRAPSPMEPAEEAEEVAPAVSKSCSEMRPKPPTSPKGQRKYSKSHDTQIQATPSIPIRPPSGLGTQGLPSTPGRASGTSTRPVTPSWLDPPWPRQEVPFDSWTRPGTPSTVCDEADLAQTPKGKFVDGQYVALRPASSSKRLPPIMHAMAEGSRRAW